MLKRTLLFLGFLGIALLSPRHVSAAPPTTTSTEEQPATQKMAQVPLHRSGETIIIYADSVSISETSSPCSMKGGSHHGMMGGMHGKAHGDGEKGMKGGCKCAKMHGGMKGGSHHGMMGGMQPWRWRGDLPAGFEMGDFENAEITKDVEVTEEDGKRIVTITKRIVIPMKNDEGKEKDAQTSRDDEDASPSQEAKGENHEATKGE